MKFATLKKDKPVKAGNILTPDPILSTVDPVKLKKIFRLGLVKAVVDYTIATQKIKNVSRFQAAIGAESRDLLEKYNASKPDRSSTASDDFESSGLNNALNILEYSPDTKSADQILKNLRKRREENKPLSPLGLYFLKLDHNNPTKNLAGLLALNKKPVAPVVVDSEDAVEDAENVVETGPLDDSENTDSVAPEAPFSFTGDKFLDFLKKSQTLSSGPGSDELRMKRLHTLENDYISQGLSDAKIPQYVEAFIKAKQKLEKQLKRPIIYGGAFKAMIVDRKKSEEFIKASKDKAVPLEAKLMNKEPTIEEQMEKIKNEDDRKKAISEFLDEESKKPSHARDSGLISRLKKEGYMEKEAVVVDKLSDVPDRITKCYANLPLKSEIVKNFKFETKELFKIAYLGRLEGDKKLIVHVTIPFVNGKPDSAYENIFTKLNASRSKTVPREVISELKGVGVFIQPKKISDDTVVSGITNDSVFDGVAYDDKVRKFDATGNLTDEEKINLDNEFNLLTQEERKNVNMKLDAKAISEQLGLKSKFEDVFKNSRNSRDVKLAVMKHDPLPPAKSLKDFSDELGWVGGKDDSDTTRANRLLSFINGDTGLQKFVIGVPVESLYIQAYKVPNITEVKNLKWHWPNLFKALTGTDRNLTVKLSSSIGEPATYKPAFEFLERGDVIKNHVQSEKTSALQVFMAELFKFKESEGIEHMLKVLHDSLSGKTGDVSNMPNKQKEPVTNERMAYLRNAMNKFTGFTSGKTTFLFDSWLKFYNSFTPDERKSLQFYILEKLKEIK